MSNVSSLFRSLFIYSLCLPLAVILGYLMANPYDIATFGVVGCVVFLLLVPLFLKWHHAWLIATWNTSMVLFFLPGRPQIWLVLSWFSLLIGMGQFILNRRMKFLAPASVIRPLIFLAIVVVITARCTGGIALRSLGADTYGGRKYVTLFSGIIGFFALTSQRIPPGRGIFYVGLFFLGALTQAIGDAFSVINPAFYGLFLLFPVNSMSGGGGDDFIASPGFVTRLGGLSLTGSAVFYFMLSRYGIEEIFNWRRLRRMVIFLFFIGISMLGGFRSMLVMYILTFAIVFYLEGLVRSRLLPIFLLCLVFGGAIMAPFIDRMPLSIQRTVSFLPIKVSPLAKASAEDSTEWRLKMWKHLLPQVPDYLILGKGYAISATDFDMMQNQMTRGSEGTGSAELVGDYHNGPLSLIIPFGIFGTIAFIWFLVAAFRVLQQNYQFGDPTLVHLNRFLLAYFVARIVFFVGVFGSLQSDLAGFTGLVGLSLCLNAGVAKAAVVPQPRLVFNRFKLHPGARRPVGAQ